jgi:hypothetical protein
MYKWQLKLALATLEGENIDKITKKRSNQPKTNAAEIFLLVH